MEKGRWHCDTMLGAEKGALWALKNAHSAWLNYFRIQVLQSLHRIKPS
jgi:hypothetical protein